MRVQDPTSTRPVSAAHADCVVCRPRSYRCQPTDPESGRTPETLKGSVARALSCQHDRHRRALSPYVAPMSYPAAMPRTTRRLDCPSCHRPVYSNHRCPGPRPAAAPEPAIPAPAHATLMLMVEQARQQARLDAHPPEQLELEL